MVWFLEKEDWMLGRQNINIPEYELAISREKKTQKNRKVLSVILLFGSPKGFDEIHR